MLSCCIPLSVWIETVYWFFFLNPLLYTEWFKVKEDCPHSNSYFTRYAVSSLRAFPTKKYTLFLKQFTYLIAILRNNFVEHLPPQSMGSPPYQEVGIYGARESIQKVIWRISYQSSGVVIKGLSSEQNIMLLVFSQ